jgi:hypothetical protein
MKLQPEYSKEVQYLKKGFSNHAAVGIEKEDKNRLQDHSKRRFEIALTFGGRTDEGLLPADLVKCKLARNKVVYERVSTRGVGPCARYNHSMTYLPKLSAVCVFGGQGVDIELSAEASNISVLNLLSLEWFTCKVKSLQNLNFENRYCHGVASHKDTLIIFGGINGGGFTDSSVEMVKVIENANFDTNEVEEPVEDLSDQSRMKSRSNKKPAATSPDGQSYQFKVISISKVSKYPDIKKNFLPLPLENAPTSPQKVANSHKSRDNQWSRIKFNAITPRVANHLETSEKKRTKSLQH